MPRSERKLRGASGCVHVHAALTLAHCIFFGHFGFDRAREEDLQRYMSTWLKPGLDWTHTTSVIPSETTTPTHASIAKKSNDVGVVPFHDQPGVNCARASVSPVGNL